MESSESLEEAVIGNAGDGGVNSEEVELSGNQDGGDAAVDLIPPPHPVSSEDKDDSCVAEEGDDGELESGGGFCFICHSDILEPSSDKQVETEPSQKPGLTMTTELDVYFVLKRVLELPPDQLKSYLRHCPFPEEWIKICRTCSVTYVEKCKDIYVELLEVSRRYTAARLELIETVRNSSKKEELADKKKRSKEEDEEEEQFIFDIGKDTLDFVKEHDYETIQVSEGENLQDLIASELSEAKLKAKKRTRTVRKREPIVIAEEDTDASQKDMATPKEAQNDSMVVNIDPFCLLEDATTAGDSNEEDPNSNESEDEDWNPDEDLQPETAEPDQDIYSTSASSSSSDSEDNSTNPTSSSKLPGFPRRRVPTRNSKDTTSDQEDDEPRKKRHKMNMREWKKNYRSQYNPSECPICQKVFSNKEYLRSHIHRVHEKKGRLNCTDCEKRFGGREGLFFHMVKIHGLGKPSTTQYAGNYSCKDCDHSFPEEYQLLFHIKFNHIPAEFSCPICDKGFHRESHLQKHLISHKNPIRKSSELNKPQLPPGLKPYPCSHCPAQYSDKKGWVKHMKDKHNKAIDGGPAGQPEVMSCPICGKLFGGRGALRDHFRSEHEHRMGHQSFDNFPEDKKTQRSERTGVEIIFKCQVCDKVFEKKAYLRQHQKRTRHGKQDVPLFSIPLNT